MSTETMMESGKMLKQLKAFFTEASTANRSIFGVEFFLGPWNFRNSTKFRPLKTAVPGL